MISIYGAMGAPRVLWAECEAKGKDDYPIPKNPRFDVITIDATCPDEKDKDKPPTKAAADGAADNPFTAGKQSADGRGDNPFIVGKQKVNSGNPFTNSGNSSSQGTGNRSKPSGGSAGSSSGENSDSSGNGGRSATTGVNTGKSSGMSNCPGLKIPLTVRFTLTGHLMAYVNYVQAAGEGSVTISSCDMEAAEDRWTGHTVHMVSDGIVTVNGQTYKLDNPHGVGKDPGYEQQNTSDGPCYYISIGPSEAPLGRAPGVVVSFLLPSSCSRQHQHQTNDDWLWFLRPEDGPAAQGPLRIE